MDHSGISLANSWAEVIDISRLRRAIATSSAPCLNSVSLSCGSYLANSLTQSANTVAIPCERKSVSVTGVDIRSVILFAAAAVGDVRHQIAAALDMGVTRFLLPPPCYFGQPSDTGLFAWFAQVLAPFATTDAQCILYHIPQIIGVGLSIDLVAALKAAFCAQVLGVKDSSGSLENTHNLLQLKGLQILVGDERLLATCVQHGISGSISGIANLFSARLVTVLATGTGDPGINNLVDEVLKCPVTPAIKALVAQEYGADA